MPLSLHVHTVPQPIVRLVSDTPNPIRSGFSPILTCAVELSPAVDVPVVGSTVWTGPDGSTLMSAAPPVMKSLTHYTSKVKLNYVESADSGKYTCTVSIGGKIRASVGKIMVIGKPKYYFCCPYDLTFRHINYVDHRRWNVSDTTEKCRCLSTMVQECTCKEKVTC